jgi:DNA-directed RNA polymerase specialized sigma24 family protein
MLLSKRKMLYFFAKRYHKDPDKQDELVNDTIVRALSKWGRFREDGSFSNWLKFLMWQVVTIQRAKKRPDTSVSLEDIKPVGVAATQEHCTDARKVLGRAVHSDLLMRLASGDRIAEIAQERGVSRSAVGQMVERHRAKFLRGMRERVAA